MNNLPLSFSSSSSPQWTLIPEYMVFSTEPYKYPEFAFSSLFLWRLFPAKVLLTRNMYLVIQRSYSFPYQYSATNRDINSVLSSGQWYHMDGDNCSLFRTVKANWNQLIISILWNTKSSHLKIWSPVFPDIFNFLRITSLRALVLSMLQKLRINWKKNLGVGLDEL